MKTLTNKQSAESSTKPQWPESHIPWTPILLHILRKYMFMIDKCIYYCVNLWLIYLCSDMLISVNHISHITTSDIFPRTWCCIWPSHVSSWRCDFHSQRIFLMLKQEEAWSSVLHNSNVWAWQQYTGILTIHHLSKQMKE